MADRRDLNFTYWLTESRHRLSLGELADFNGAKYDGDYSLSLEQAQKRKHDICDLNAAFFDRRRSERWNGLIGAA